MRVLACIDVFGQGKYLALGHWTDFVSGWLKFQFFLLSFDQMQFLLDILDSILPVLWP